MTDSLTYTADVAASHTYPGVFIAFEGGDGAGKSTQIQRLANTLVAQGKKVLVLREPGGTDIGESLRALVLEHGNGVIDARTEALIFAASRSALAHQKIIPALQEGTVVLSDRYIDSSAAYQGAGRELGIDSIVDLSLWATENLLPHLTILLDVPVGAGRTRTTARGQADRMEAEPDSFHTRVHNTFSLLAAKDSSRYAVIDGTRSIEEVEKDVFTAVLPYLRGEQ